MLIQEESVVAMRCAKIYTQRITYRVFDGKEKY